MRRLFSVLAVAIALAVVGCSKGGGPQPGGTGPVPRGKVRVTWYGHSMFLVQDSRMSVVTDPYGPELGYIVPRVSADVVLISHNHYDHNNAAAVGGDPRVVNSIGETYVGGLTIAGAPSLHGNVGGKKKEPNTVYSWEMAGVKFAHMGDFGQRKLTDQQEAFLRRVDILMMPVGGVGTVDGPTAARLTEVIGPKVVIPMHYKTKAVLIDLQRVEGFTSRLARVIRHVGRSFEVSRNKLPQATEVWVMNYGGQAGPAVSKREGGGRQ